MLSITKAAKELEVMPSTLRSWADRGLVPVTRLPTGYRRFTAAQMEEIKQKMLEKLLTRT